MTTDTSKHSQCLTLLSHFKQGRSITQAEAMECYGIARLASRINDLKNRGYEVNRVMITVTNRKNEQCRVARYWMEGNV